MINKKTKFYFKDICVNPQNFINKFLFYKIGKTSYLRFIYKIDSNNRIYFYLKTFYKIEDKTKYYYEFQDQDDSDLLYLEILKINGFVF